MWGFLACAMRVTHLKWCLVRDRRDSLELQDLSCILQLQWRIPFIFLTSQSHQSSIMRDMAWELSFFPEWVLLTGNQENHFLKIWPSNYHPALKIIKFIKTFLNRCMPMCKVTMNYYDSLPYAHRRRLGPCLKELKAAPGSHLGRA